MHSVLMQRVFSIGVSLTIFMNSVSYGHNKSIDIPEEVIETTAVVETVAEDVFVEEPEEVVVETPVEPVEPEPEYFVDVVNGVITEESLKSICRYVGNMYDINPELLQAIAWVESRYQVKATSNCDARGLCQVIPKWHRQRANKLGVTDFYDPYGSVLICADILDELSRHEYGDDIRYVLMAYNRGQYGDTGANALYKKGVITNYATEVLAKEQEFKSNSLVK